VSIEALAFAAAIASGFLHAVWNALAQRSNDAAAAMIAQICIAGIAAALACVFIGWPNASVWHWMALGSIANAMAMLLISAAYKRGDYAVTYGISRATAPWVLMPLSLWVSQGSFGPLGGLGVAAVSFGVFLAATQGNKSKGDHVGAADARAASAFAVASGLCVAFSIFSDARGAIGVGALEYGVAQTVLNALVVSVIFQIQSGRSVVAIVRINWRIGVGSAFISSLSYLLILWVFTILPTVIGASLRDSSMVFALLIGTFFFRERLAPLQWVGCAAFIGGVLLLRASS
jgi:drug/metabolite transporter (DMT)-like permease